MGVVKRPAGVERDRTEPHDGELDSKLNSGSMGSSGSSENAACEETTSEVLAEVLAEVHRLCTNNDCSIWPRAPYRLQAPVERALPLKSLVN